MLVFMTVKFITIKLLHCRHRASWVSPSLVWLKVRPHFPFQVCMQYWWSLYSCSYPFICLFCLVSGCNILIVGTSTSDRWCFQPHTAGLECWNLCLEGDVTIHFTILRLSLLSWANMHKSPFINSFQYIYCSQVINSNIAIIWVVVAI